MPILWTEGYSTSVLVQTWSSLLFQWVPVESKTQMLLVYIPEPAQTLPFELVLQYSTHVRSGRISGFWTPVAEL